jgi:hypothetical protein
MSDFERMDEALMHAHAAKKEIERGTEHPDNVERRRCMVRAAKHWRKAADLVDDHGRLTE